MVIKKLYQELKGIKGNGFLLTKYQLADSTLIRGATLVVKHKLIVSVTHANDKGWWDGKGEVRWFQFENEKLFVGRLAFAVNALKRKEKPGTTT